MKKGFTLAEVLITLAIIGVVAALTAPALNSAIQKAKVPPTLRKFISTMEVAHEHLLGDSDDNLLSSAVGGTTAAEIETRYFEELKKYVKGTYDNTSEKNDTYSNVALYKKIPTYYSKKDDGTPDKLNLDDSAEHVFHMDSGQDFIIGFNDISEYAPGETYAAKGSYKGAWATVYFDIDGFAAGPNKVGKDLFRLTIDNSGSIIPYGGKQMSDAYTAQEEFLWDNTPESGTASNKCDESEVNNGDSCAGSIADNSWRVIYKY